MRSALLCFAGASMLAAVCPSAIAGAEDKGWGYRPRYDADGWEVLFDGKDLDAWDFNRAKKGWVITDEGELYRAAKSGDIWSKRRYCDFVLDIEFKVAKGTNSGVFIRTHSRRDWLHTGIEVQVLDSAGKKEPGKHDTGAVYDVKAPMKNTMRPAGEWNRYVLRVDENVIMVELNGELVNEMNLDDWPEPHKNADGSKNKFKYAYKDMIREGFFALQDHGRPVWYRNIKVKALGKRKPLFTGKESYDSVKEREFKAREERILRRELDRKRELEQKQASARTGRAASSAAPKTGKTKSDAAAERLAKIARQAERMGQRHAAASLYAKIVADYPGSAAAERASARLKSLRP